MSRRKKSLFILSSFVLGSFLCSFLVVKELERQDREAYAVRYHEYQRVALAHDKAQYARQKNIGRSIATYSKDAEPVVIINQKIDIRIYQITKITKIVKNDRALLAELSKKERQIRRLLKVNRGQKKEIAQLKQDLADVQRQMQDSQASLEKQVTELEAEKENLKKLLAEAEAQNVEIVSRRDELQEKLDEAQLMIEETKKEAEELSVKVTELNAKIEEQEAMIAELKKANCEKQDKISKLEEEVAGHIADKEEIMTKIEELEEELASLEEDEDADEEDEDSDSDSDTTPRRVASNDNNALVVQQMMAAFSQQMQMQQFQMQAQMFTQINQQPVGMDQFTMMTMMNNMMMSNMMGKMATGGWGMPGGMASYDHLLHSPTYSLMDPVYSPVFYDQGIPSGIGLGRSPAVSPVQRQGNIFTKVPQSF
jgi:chromosome segregation ATPase